MLQTIVTILALNKSSIGSPHLYFKLQKMLLAQEFGMFLFWPLVTPL